MKPQFHLPLSTYPDASSFVIVSNAIEFARQQGADLIASISQVRVPPVRQPFPTAIDVDRWRAEAEGFSRESGSSLRSYLSEAASKTSVDVRTHDFDAPEPNVCQAFAEISRAHDLSIVEASEITRPLVETLLFEGGRPVLLFPPSDFCCRVETVAIAWDGSSTAARAISSASQFIDSATKILVISVTDDKQINNVNRALFLSALKHSGLLIEDVSVMVGAETTAAAIQSAALEHRADILVAGGFGHSRFREFILGGVTRELLVKGDLPILLAH